MINRRFMWPTEDEKGQIMCVSWAYAKVFWNREYLGSIHLSTRLR